jgi:GT2 family glycosyltransferase
MYYEDVEICARVAHSGKRLCYVPEARIVHMGGQSTAQSPAKRQLYAMQNGQAPWMYFKYYRGPVAAMLFSGLVGVGSIFRLVVARLLAPFRKAESERLASEAGAMLWWAFYSKEKFPRLFDGWFATEPAVQDAEKDREAKV